MKFIRNIVNDRMYGSSLWLIADSAMLTVFGFFFWTINARLFSSEDVGLASALIAAAELLVTISLLGFDIALIKYLPSFKKRNLILNSMFSLAGIAAFLVSLIFVLKIDIFSPKLNLLKNSAFAVSFVVFIVFNLLSVLLGSVFIGLKKPKFTFIQDAVFSTLKLAFPFAFVFLGAYGIFSSWMVSIAISFIVGLLILRHMPKFEIHKKTLKKIFKFSFVNYLSNFLSRAPKLVLPLMIANLVSSRSTAYFYIAWMISSVLFIIPFSASRSLLALDPRNKKGLRINIRKSFKFTFCLLVPSMIIAVLLSKHLLLLFGKEYSENAFRLLQILALSSLPYAINIIYISIKNVQNRMNAVFGMNLFIAAGTLVSSYFLMGYGIAMIGLSWLAVQIIAAVYSAAGLIRETKNEK